MILPVYTVAFPESYLVCCMVYPNGDSVFLYSDSSH